MEHKIIETLKWRYATKKFDANKKISTEKWNAIEDALVLSPSSYGLQPWKFVVVTNPEKRQELKPFTWNQGQVVDASHYVVFAAKQTIDEQYVDHWMKAVANGRKTDVSNVAGYKQLIMNKVVNNTDKLFNFPAWAERQTYIALGNVMTVAATLEIDTCAIEGIDDFAKYHEVLKLPANEWTILCGLALGYRAEDDKYASVPKVRFNKNEVIKHI
jgi:nitroreductase